MRRIFSAALAAIVTLGLVAPAVAADDGRPLWMVVRRHDLL